MTRHHDASAPEVPRETVGLTHGRMPLLGFGTWQLRGRAAAAATAAALEAGYRHLDTATIYGNEADVGTALRDSGVPREDVFLTTKCPPERVGRELETLRQSLDRLGTDRVDLWLVHWSGSRADNRRLWEAFVQAQRDGLARDIGVSNFDGSLIDDVVRATGVTPAVDQVRWSPLLFDPTVVADHRSRGVVLEGYSGLRGGTLTHPVIKQVAEETGRTTAQVIVRWHLQHGIVVIPKSTHADRIRSNADVAGFELTADQMARLDALGRT